jgi:hypothetical protein
MRERLDLTIELTLAGVAHAIPGGDVRFVALTLTPWGVEGTVEFFVKDDTAHGGAHTDTVLSDFIKPDLGTVKVTVGGVSTDLRVVASLPKLVTQGVIVDRSFTEETWLPGVASSPLLLRGYRVRFVDRAGALWTQHRPWSLYTETTLQAVIDAERGSVDVTYDWEKLTVARPLVFTGLHADAAPSFRDFVLWCVTREGGVFTYDHAAGAYAIKGAKAADGEAGVIIRDEVAKTTNSFGEVPRCQPRVVNVNVDRTLAKRTSLDAAQAATGVYRDLVVRYPTQQEVDDEAALTGHKPVIPPRTLELEFAAFPTVPIAPGSLVDLSTKGGFSADLMTSAEPWRVYGVNLVARSLAESPDDGDQIAFGSFDVTLSAKLEAKSDATPRTPPFQRPEYPGYVEGTVLCEGGAEGEFPYEFKQDAVTSLDVYRVGLPIFDDQEVNPPYDPELLGSVLYLPACKGARVLVALSFDRCLIVRLLEWRDGARVPMDPQGQHLLLGKSDKSSTSVLHDYQAEKPVFRILRTNDKDTTLLRFEEGRMVLQVKENKDS